MTRNSFGLCFLVALYGCDNGGGPVNSDTDTDSTEPVFVETATPSDMNDSIEEAVDLTAEEIPAFTIVGIAQDRINPAGDRDFYALNLEGGELYQFYTEAYDPATDSVVLDTVIRIYNEAGTMITENDDMVYRYRETDSAVFVSPATTGTFYAEVLEYCDWSGQCNPAGTYNHEYALNIVNVPFTEREGENDTLDAVFIDDDAPDDTDVDTDVDTDADDTPLYITSPVSNYAIDFYGRVDTAEDQDWWPISIADDSEDPNGSPETHSFLSLAMWPDIGETTPNMALYNGAGELLGETSDPVPGSNSLYIDDAGILSYVEEGNTYYVKVSAGDGPTGVEGWYPAIRFTYLPILADLEEEPNNEVGQAQFFPLEESQSTEGFYSGGIMGGLGDNDNDILKLSNADVGGFADKFVTVVVRAVDIGSQLDPKLEILNADGDVLQEISVDSAIEDHPDPVLRDYVPGVDGDLYIRISADALGTEATAQQWLVGVYIFNETLF
jgi:hypothetical protein